MSLGGASSWGRNPLPSAPKVEVAGQGGGGLYPEGPAVTSQNFGMLKKSQEIKTFWQGKNFFENCLKENLKLKENPKDNKVLWPIKKYFGFSNKLSISILKVLKLK